MLGVSPSNKVSRIRAYMHLALTEVGGGLVHPTSSAGMTLCGRRPPDTTPDRPASGAGNRLSSQSEAG